MQSPLLDLFVSEATAATPTRPWQQELLETVNPEKMKKQRIAQAIAQASQAMATTPGDFLTGLSAAATTGANSYISQRGMDDDRRTQAMRQIEEANDRDKQLRLSRLQAAIGLRQDADNDLYRRERDQTQDQRYDQEREDKNRIAQQNYELRKMNYESLSQYRVDQVKVRAEKQAIKTAAGGDVERERRLRLDAVYRNLNEFTKALPTAYADEDRVQNDKITAEKRAELEQAYGINASTGEMMDAPGTIAPPQQPGAPSSVSPAPAPTSTTGKGDKQPKPAQDEALRQARDAIAKGANPQAVRERLLQSGYDPAGL